MSAPGRPRPDRRELLTGWERRWRERHRTQLVGEELDGLAWRRPVTAGATAMEIAPYGPDEVVLRNAAAPDGVGLRFPRTELAAVLLAAREGAYADLLTSGPEEPADV